MKPVSDQLFIFEHPDKPRPGPERCSAKELGLKESWLSDAIFETPELVIGPCRAAGLTDDEWYPWEREFRVEVGKIDVLLLSSEGRVAVVETKLAGNPELRRRVLAQALDYLAHLPDRLREELPPIPRDENGEPVASEEDILESVDQADVLVIIASDEADPRVARLSQTLLADHLINQWDLALVDVALYRPTDGSPGHIVVPHLRRLVQSDPRQVVRVVVEGETPSARIEIERITDDGWGLGERRFFRHLERGTVPGAIFRLAKQVRDLRERYPETVSLSWGRGKKGGMVLKRNDGALIEFRPTGRIKFRTKKFNRALGEERAKEYRRELEELVPRAMGMPLPTLSVTEAKENAQQLFELLQRTIEEAEKSDASATTESST